MAMQSLVEGTILCHVPQEAPLFYVRDLIQYCAYAEQPAGVCVEVRQ